MRAGPRNLITDVEGLLVGNASDDRLKSGTTVITASGPFGASAEVMGGAPGTRELALLDPDRIVDGVDAIVLSGGSAFGLDAASGVQQALRDRGRGYPVGDTVVPIVPAAIVFDLAAGGDQSWSTNPYGALGRAAFAAADADFALGTAGAGVGATTGTHKGGLGSASVVLDDGTTVGAVAVANAVGSANVPGHRNFWAAPFEFGDEFGGLGHAAPADPSGMPDSRKIDGGDRASTTIAVVATDADLSKSQLKRIAVAAHDGIARAVVPSHTPKDGDLVFSVSTRARPLADPGVDVLHIGHAAATCLARAIARAVYLATPAEGDVVPAWSSGR